MAILEFIVNNKNFYAEKFNENSYKILPFENIPVFNSVSKYKKGYNVIAVN